MIRDRVFRGCTRPAMFLGVPMVPFILVTGASVLFAMLALYVSAVATMVVIALYLPVYLWMRLVTKQDDQRLHQLILRLRLRTRMGKSRKVWKAVTYTPLSYKRR